MLDNLVSVSELGHGGASRAIGYVGDDNSVAIMRNNKPAAVIISPDDCKRFTKTEENFALHLEAAERLSKDDGVQLTTEEVFGNDYRPVEDGYEPEFE